MSQHSKKDSKEISKILDFLEPEEHVILMAKGSETVFLTDRRLLIRKNSVLRRKTIKDISYEKILNIQLKKGIISSKVSISTSEYNITIRSLKHELARCLLEHINEISSQSRSTIDYNNQEIKDLPEMKLDLDPEKSEKRLTSILDELERLSKLRNDGVLTEDEFQLMKRDILKKIST
jgi:hypothetical protein